MKRIRTFGEPVLRTKCEPVREINEKVSGTVRLLKETLVASKGLGLAAPQIGIKKRVFVARNPETGKILTLINPLLVEKKEPVIDLEGCLSFPEVFFSISRHSKVTVTGLDERGRKFTIEATGLLARCFQHECDHLDGILIIDYATEEEKSFWKETLEKIAHRRKI
ncbi:MAG: peptide deformylase [Candidatus Omnitrophica bacterium]|nr:peptide deformylase [Candidatus Omnitrophota bacterium]